MLHLSHLDKSLVQSTKIHALYIKMHPPPSSVCYTLLELRVTHVSYYNMYSVKFCKSTRIVSRVGWVLDTLGIGQSPDKLRKRK